MSAIIRNPNQGDIPFFISKPITNLQYFFQSLYFLFVLSVVGHDWQSFSLSMNHYKYHEMEITMQGKFK